MGTCPGILGNARACLVGHLGRKCSVNLSQAKSKLNAKEKEEIGKQGKEGFFAKSQVLNKKNKIKYFSFPKPE